jgi:hypothetical protein
MVHAALARVSEAAVSVPQSANPVVLACDRMVDADNRRQTQGKWRASHDRRCRSGTDIAFDAIGVKTRSERTTAQNVVPHLNAWLLFSSNAEYPDAGCSAGWAGLGGGLNYRR